MKKSPGRPVDAVGGVARAPIDMRPTARAPRPTPSLPEVAVPSTFTAAKRRVVTPWLVLGGVVVALGAYLLLLAAAPMPDPPALPARPAQASTAPIQLTADRLTIPRLALDLPYKTGDKTALNDALWHRYPDRGDPVSGGNFILAGHRFVIGLTPGQTRRKSPLYHIDKLKVGDYLYADFRGQRYQYQVSRIYRVKPTATSIEAPSPTAKLTLYTCTLGGETDGRSVVEATLVKKHLDPSAILKVSISE